MKNLQKILIILFTIGLYGQEQPPVSSDNSNWVSSISYSIDGQTLSKGIGFYNTLGKSTQSQSWDVLTQKVWASETLYDYHGRPAFQTLSAPINTTSIFGYDSDFIRDNTNGDYTILDFEGNYTTNPKSVSSTSKLGSYYWNSTVNNYQDNTSYPFSRAVYSKLNPGSVKKVLGGNKINGEWLQGYTFSMPVGQELSTNQSFGNSATAYDNMRITKTVSRDVHGVEVVVFTDSDGNTLAAARSGDEEDAHSLSSTTLTIKEQGYVDVHIPKGATGVNINNPEAIVLKIYDLTTEGIVVNNITSSYTLSPGFYRIAVKQPETYIYNESQPIKVTHTVNYYDYTLNYYDKAGRLIESTQPNGANYSSTYKYNSLGQLLTTTSPDEGTAEFIYRKDGQIRFSQNSEQKKNDAFSYTNYDRLGRPIESGEYRGDDIYFNLAPETTPTPPMQTFPSPVTFGTSQNIQGYLGLSGNPPYFERTNAPGEWASGFTSSETIEENGKVAFKSGSGGSGPTQFGDYQVVLGFSPVLNASNSNGYVHTNIKYGVSLNNTSGIKVVQLLSNGDYLRDASNQVINYETYTDNDVFAVERIDGVITFLKNNIVFHTIADNYLEPLVVDGYFRYYRNAINSIILEESGYTAPPTPSGTDIQTLVDVQDGLIDANCYEQNFTLYDIPDQELVGKLNECGLPLKAYKQTFLSGNVSKTYTKSPETTTTWYSYDVYGRVTWVIQSINGLGCLKTIDYAYDDITGQVVEVDYQRHTNNERFIHRYSYNVGGQLVQVDTSIDNVNYTEQAAYFYNETGQLVRTELAEDLQGIDYVYNLSGQLKAINHPSLTSTNDPGHDGNNGFAADVFGMALQYYDGDYTRTNTPTSLANITASTPDQFNGNIQAIQWQNETGSPSTYAYEYNKNNWLKGAYYSHPSNSNTSDYNVENITYDANGNIKTLKRNGVTNASGSNAMDDFTYKYLTGKNQLDQVEDTNDNIDPTRYDDLKHQEKNNYVYNSIGQLIISKQDKALYSYNASGLVTNVKELQDNDTGQYYTLTTEDYSQSKLYPAWQSLGSLSQVSQSHQTDQIDSYTGVLPPNVTDANQIKLPSYCTDFDNDTLYEDRYQINFYNFERSVPNTYTATRLFSVTKDAYHKLDFDVLVYQKQWIVNPFDGTNGEQAMNASATITLKQLDGTVIATHVIDAQTATQSYCDRIVDHISFEFIATEGKVTAEIEIVNDGLNPNGYGNPSSLYKSLYQSFEVDNVHLQIATKDKLAFYYNDRGQRVRKDSYVGSDLVQTVYVRDVSGSPMGIYYRPGRAAITLKENPVYGLGRIGVLNRTSGSRTGGNYVYQLTDHLGNVRAVVAKAGPGAIALTQKTDYYPFGMAMPDRNVEGNYRYGYQGEFAEKDPETGLNAFELRLWDSRIGRWTSPDPYGQYFSPYLGMGNNPINGVDPDGGCFIKNEDGSYSECNPGAEIGSTITGVDGHEYTMTENGWWSDSAHSDYGVSLTGFSEGFKEVLSTTTTLFGIAEGATQELTNSDEIFKAVKDNKFLTKSLNSNNVLRSYQVGAGGLPKFKGNQHTAYDDVLTAAKRFKVKAGTLKVLKGTGVLAGVIGTGLSIHDIGTNGLNLENGADTVVGVIGFVPGYGWIVVGVYYIVAKPLAKEANKAYEWLKSNVRISTDGGSIMRGFSPHY